MLATFRNHLSSSLVFSAIVFAIAFFVPTRAHAISGREAVGVCIDSTAGGARCGWSVNGKGEIDICNKNGCVYCASADSQCVVAKVKPGGGPSRGIPVGSTVLTPLGTYKVSSRVYDGPILRAPVLKSQEAEGSGGSQ